jgi:hypothetical protein
MSPAQEQLARVKRYLGRMERMGAADDDTDDMYSFFMHAWHLADWAFSDPTLNPRPLNLAHLKKVDATNAIQLCGDIAEARKHHTLTLPPRPMGK